MQMNVLKFPVLIAIVLGVVVGCASAPTQEMSDARQAIQAARDAGAVQHAPDTLGSAEKLLGWAEQALEEGDYDKARTDAVAAKEEAVKARNMALAIAAAKDALERAKGESFAWRDTEKLIAKAEAAAAKGDEAMAVRIANEATKQSELAIKQAMRERDRYRTTIPSAPAGAMYTVVRGDSLWRISARPGVYGDPYRWPLIFRANADQIRDADLIHPGQALTVRQSPDGAEVDAAVRHARTRGAWEVGRVESSDQGFLGR